MRDATRRARAASRFDERMAAGPALFAALCETQDTPACRLWKRLLGDAPGSSLRWQRRLAWDGWSVQAACAALAQPVDMPELAQQLVQLQPALDWTRADGRPDWARWAEQVFTDALPAASATERNSLRPLQEVLAQHFARVGSALASHGGSIEAAFETWPVLARQLAEARTQASAQLRTLWHRLHADADARAQTFGLEFGAWPLRISAADCDRHRDGQQVLRLEFAAGALYFKPRCLRIDVAFAEVCRALAAAGLPAPPALPALALDGYGYQAEARALSDPSVLPGSVFEDFGALLALAWLGNARDLHRDNLQLTARGLQLFDLEALLQPERAAADAYENGVLANGLLDFRCASSGQDAAGIGALEQALGRHLTEDEQARIDSGFRRLLHALCSTGTQALLSRLFEPTLMLRVVYRPSAVYASVLAALREPRALGDGALGILATDSLHAPLLDYPQPPPEWALAAEERAQLERGDIPLFELSAQARGLRVDGPELFVRSANEVLTQRLGTLDSRAIDAQAQQLRTALQLRAQPHCSGLAGRLAAWSGQPTAPSLLRGVAGELLAAVQADAHAFALSDPGRDAELDLDGAGVSSTASLLHSIREQPLPAALDLDGGVAGLLFALAVQALRAPQAAELELAERCAMTLLQPALPVGYSGQPQPGLAHGLAGMALALGLAARAFDQPHWRAHAEQLCVAEDALFDPHTANWPATPGQPAALNAWCNGASGVLLARAMLGLGLNSPAAQAARAALSTLPEASVDHLCCGELGRLLAWQAIARITADDALAAVADTRFDTLQQRWAQRRERLDQPRGLSLLRGVRGLAWGWSAYRDAALPNPALLGLRWSELHD
jgi:lantibiotic modifying enzyme